MAYGTVEDTVEATKKVLWNWQEEILQCWLLLNLHLRSQNAILAFTMIINISEKSFDMFMEFSFQMATLNKFWVFSFLNFIIPYFIALGKLKQIIKSLIKTMQNKYELKTKLCLD